MGWFEITEYSDKYAITIANLLKNTWIIRYPWLTETTYGQGLEYFGHKFRKSSIEKYDILTNSSL